MRRLIALLSLLAVSPVVAQDAVPDWDIARNPEDRLVTAAIPLTTGLGLVVRCSGRTYEALILGLPEVEGDTRQLDIAFGDEPLHPETWNVAVDQTVAVSSLPAPFARELRKGGRMQIRVPNATGDGRAVRHVLDLPPSSAAIDETLTACDRPLDDPRDALIENPGPGGLPSGVSWVRAPRPVYPVNFAYARGFVSLSCLTTREGALNECVVESEYPSDGYFGEAALRSTRNARVGVTDAPGQAVPIRRIVFRINFRIRR